MARRDNTQNEETTVGRDVTVKDAVRLALQFLYDLYETDQLLDLRLEEVELSDDGRRWLVTYGFTVIEPNPENNPFLGALSGTLRNRRDYKTIEVDARTGKPLSMKIRTL